MLTRNLATGDLAGVLGGWIAAPLRPATNGLMSAGADALGARQGRRVAIAAATAAGVWVLAAAAGERTIAVALAPIQLPYGAYDPGAEDPPNLLSAGTAYRFTAASLTPHAVLWALIAALSGYFWQRRPAVAWRPT
jgi:predicted cobalt transporter CbtA